MTTRTEPATSIDTPETADSSTTRVLIADKFQPSGIHALERLGCDIDFQPELTPDQIAQTVSRTDPDILIVRGTKVPGATFETADKLGLVIRAGAGYDSIDVAAASQRGVFVANCPGKNAIAVAELVWALILSCDRRVPDQTADLRSGTWAKKEYAKARGLYGRTLGIVGMGRIGQAVASRGRAFGMHVVAWSRSLTEEKADALEVGYCSSLINLAKMADVVSVNVAATPDTKELIDAKFCQAMQPNAYLINTSRGSVVDSLALTEAIREKGIRAGLDVFANEPSAAEKAFGDPIANEPGVYGTHHIGASTDQAQEAIASEAIRIVEAYLQTGDAPNCVNRAASTSATQMLTVRHLNQPGVLAHVFYTLGQARINVEEMENIIYEGGQAACARIQLDDVPSPELMNTIRTNENVLSVNLTCIETTA